MNISHALRARYTWKKALHFALTALSTDKLLLYIWKKKEKTDLWEHETI